MIQWFDNNNTGYHVLYGVSINKHTTTIYRIVKMEWRNVSLNWNIQIENYDRAENDDYVKVPETIYVPGDYETLEEARQVVEKLHEGLVRI